MSKEPRIKGAPPSRLTGQARVSSLDSPWWAQVASELVSRPGMVGRVATIEEITLEVPDYPDGRRPRPRAVSRRLSHILELVERGPNGSRSRGARYRILDLEVSDVIPDDDAPKDENDDYLAAHIRRMLGDDR